MGKLDAEEDGRAVPWRFFSQSPITFSPRVASHDLEPLGFCFQDSVPTASHSGPLRYLACIRQPMKRSPGWACIFCTEHAGNLDLAAALTTVVLRTQCEKEVICIPRNHQTAALGEGGMTTGPNTV